MKSIVQIVTLSLALLLGGGVCLAETPDTNPNAGTFLRGFLKNDAKRLAEYQKRLGRDPSFRMYLKKNKLTWRPSTKSEDKIKVIEGYLNGYFQRFQGESLDKLRDGALRKTLEAHGIHSAAGQAWETLRRVSGQNRDRLTRKKYVSKPQMREAEEIVDRLDIIFVHNSRGFQKGSHLPVLSPSQVDFLHLDSASGTRAFAKEILFSDDQVFFFAKIGMSPKLSDLRSLYGWDILILNSQYGENQGWISAFSEEPGDLIAAGKRTSPRAAHNLQAELEKVLSPKAVKNLFSERYESDRLNRFHYQWRSLTNSLKETDFTLADFWTVFRNQILLKLDSLREHNPAQFRAALEQMNSGSTLDTRSQLLDTLVFKPLGLPSVYELRVPVAVPDDQLTLVE